MFFENHLFIPNVNNLSFREFYFSVENLETDTFTLCRLDDEGFVPLSLIMTYRRITHLTNDPELVLEALKISEVLEIDNDIRVSIY